MKKLFTFLLLLTTVTIHAQSWIDMGVPGFSNGYASYINLATGGTTSYIAYQDNNANYGATVKKFDGTNWTSVGIPDFSNGQANFLSLAMNGNTPYVAYMDYNDYGATVKKFDGSNWINVGTPGFSAGYAENIKLAMSGNTPYVAYLDYDNYYAVTVKKFDDSNWVNVGAPGFSSGYADNISIAMIGNRPYVAYFDYNNNAVTVKMFDDSNWVNVGTPDYYAGYSDNISLVMNGTTPYIAYRSYNDYNPTVKKFNGTNWVDVSTTPFSGQPADYISLAISASTPYLAYYDYTTGGSTVKRFNGTDWVTIGNAGFSGSQVDFLKLAVNGTVPYVAYIDYASGGITAKQFDSNALPTPATALKFDGANDYVNCGNKPGINNLGLNGFTLEAWVNPSTVGPAVSIIRKTGDYNLYIFGGRLYVEYWYNGAGNNNFKQFSGTIIIPTNIWTHVAATWNGTTASLYVNGVLNNGSSISATGGYAENLWLGFSSIFGNPFAGSMDEVRIWNRALCQSEIQNNMNGELNPALQTGLMAYYQFNNGIVGANNAGITSVADASGNGNNGILNNFTLAGTSSNWVNGTVTGNAPVFIPAILAGTAGGAPVCQSNTVHAAETYYTDNTCGLIAGIIPSGISPVSGIVNTCVKVDSSVQFYNGYPYVQRHYDISPAANAATATATVTLYYTQEEFNAYNLVRGANPPLPTAGNDATGIANILITQYHGTGTAPGNYTGTAVSIHPADINIVWNSTYSRWEISFDINGFSGFYLSTGLGGVLPLHLISFSGSKKNNGNVLQWQTANEINTKQFEIESSSNGNNFSSMATVMAKGVDNASYTFTDPAIFVDKIFYRLKITDNNGSFTYSNVIKITAQPFSQLMVYPNPVKDKATIQINDKKLIGTTAKIIDVSGKTMQSFTIKNNFEIIEMSGLPPGIYMLQTNDGGIQKLIKQ